MQQNVLNETRLGDCTLRINADGKKTVEIDFTKLQELNDWIDTLKGVQTIDAITSFYEEPQDEEQGQIAMATFMSFYRTVCIVANRVRKLCPEEWLTMPQPVPKLGI